MELRVVGKAVSISFLETYKSVRRHCLLVNYGCANGCLRLSEVTLVDCSVRINRCLVTRDVQGYAKCMATKVNIFYLNLYMQLQMYS